MLGRLPRPRNETRGFLHAARLAAIKPGVIFVNTARADIVDNVALARLLATGHVRHAATECMLAARHYGVEADVLRTMGDTLPHSDWSGLARHVISRALIHGKRRAEEMREVARTVDDAGVEPLFSRATAER